MSVKTLGKSHFGKEDNPEVNYRLPTGCLRLDLAIGGNDTMGYGLPGGTVTEVFGDSMAGKTTSALGCCCQAQRLGGEAIWLDIEGRFSTSLAEKYNGINREHGWSYYKTDKDGRPLTVETVLDYLMDLGAESLDKPTPTVVVIDSLAALRSKDQDPEASAKRQMGKVANVLSGWFSYGFTSMISGSNFYLIVINQKRQKLDFFHVGPPQSTTPAGKALKFYASTRLEYKSKKLTKSLDPNSDKFHDQIGIWVDVSVEKNTFDPPFRKAAFPFYFYDQIPDYESEDQRIIGMDDYLSQLDFLIARKALEPGKTKDGKKLRKGYWEIGGVSNSKLGWRERMRVEPEVREAVEQKVRETFKAEYG